MARAADTRRYDTTAYRASVKHMAATGEAVHDLGRKHREKTGKIHELVDVTKNRGSHNAMVRIGEDLVLVNGIALPIIAMFDGTGSTSQWLDDFFHAGERQFNMLDGARSRYNTQLASAVVQDVVDTVGHFGVPVVQLSQFETDERSAEQVRLLQPAGAGGDAAEDYDLGLAAGLFVHTDIVPKYGLKGYFTVTADDKGRGFVTDENVKTHLGKSLEQSGLFQNPKRVGTDEVCQKLLDRWHLFMLQVPTGGGMLSYSTNWWNSVLGPGRVIPVENPRLLAEVRSALVYVTEAINPTQKGLGEYLSGGDQELEQGIVSKVWKIVQAAEEHFGAQAKLPGYDDIPKPGDKFRDLYDAWPIGHPRESENVTPAESK